MKLRSPGRKGRPNRKLPVPTREELARGAGFLRQRQILPHLMPVSSSKWWLGIERGIYPKPVKLDPAGRSIAWSMKSIADLLERLERGDAKSSA